jgi:ribosomal protein L31E
VHDRVEVVFDVVARHFRKFKGEEVVVSFEIFDAILVEGNEAVALRVHVHVLKKTSHGNNQ